LEYNRKGPDERTEGLAGHGIGGRERRMDVRTGTAGKGVGLEEVLPSFSAFNLP